jgi:glycosyltransferase involved in cell wall biosynthesis
MRVIHVTDADLPARRFNGFDLLDDLASRGVEGTQVVLNKTSDDPRVLGLLQGRGDAELQDSIKEVERRHSINNLLTPWGALLASTSQFREADVVHYHLIHNQVISLYDMERLFGLKPTVWSFHDPWPLTGHCVHPMGCEGWLRGCDPCPFLDRLFPLAHDHADQLWRAKKRVFSGLDVDVVVASEWLLEMVKRSALTSHFEQVHLIPFGIDTRLFVANDRKQSSRRRLGVPDDDFVIFFRATSWDVKGLSSILEALAARPPTRPTTVLTVDERGLLKGLRREYRVVELGWIDDEAMYPLTFSACDVFLMPSLAETFGLMAVEAMAAGRPVVCFEGTALPAVTHAPECGIAVSAGNANALRDALDRLASDSSESERRGQLGRSIVADVYGHERYLDSMAALYRSVLARHQTGDMAESVR